MDYARALEVSVEAARAAGAILRRDFHLPGGPRGGGEKAPADTEAEHEIRARLTAAFPDAGYVGEETGSRSRPADPSHVWLVDPNDGTVAYLAGYRGSAVSIALLRDGVPVLGVVYAFSAPDDDGDLFAWAEGCGPMTRNGAAVPPRAWPASLDAGVVVLSAYAADRKAEANADAVAPGRFRAVPSIAYRLALVAAGEGDATTSLNAPGAWDYAAGHALLASAGGALVNERGEAVTYTRQGASGVRFAFGGAPAVVAELTRRDWQAVLASTAPAGERYDLIRPEKGRRTADPARLARAHGCLLGQCAGDALGSLVEFLRPDAIRARYPQGVRAMADGGTWSTIAGQPTDDTELALVLARSIVAAGGYDAEAAAQAYAFWCRSAPFDCGITTATALRGIGEEDAEAGRAAEAARAHASRDSQSNGCLMRVSPLAVWAHALAPEEAAAHARADASLTNPHPVCGDAVAVFVVAAAHAVASGDAAGEVYRFARDWARSARLEPAVVRVVEAAEGEPPDFLTHQGWVLVALQNAFHRLVHAAGVEDGVVASVMAGGDTDTNGAIAGALLGAVHGREAVPRRWREAVLSCRPMAGRRGVRRPRPRAFWPVDVLEIAERLLVLGERKAAGA